MDNFFSKVSKNSINATYHNPYAFLTTETTKTKKSKRIGDFDTTLWLETGGLTVLMSLLLLIPTFF